MRPLNLQWVVLKIGTDSHNGLIPKLDFANCNGNTFFRGILNRHLKI